jgi:hypothetical protein
METSPSAAAIGATTAKKPPQDVIIIFESSAFINVCYESIIENYIKPLVKYFYNVPSIDELGLTKELSQTLISAIAYRSIDCSPMSICSSIQPTSHPKLFLDRLETFLE